MQDFRAAVERLLQRFFDAFAEACLCAGEGTGFALGFGGTLAATGGKEADLAPHRAPTCRTGFGGWACSPAWRPAAVAVWAFCTSAGDGMAPPALLVGGRRAN